MKQVHLMDSYMETRVLSKWLSEHPDHRFIPDNADLAEMGEIELSLVHGYRQVTEIYLVMLTDRNRCRLVSLDSNLAQSVPQTPFPTVLIFRMYLIFPTKPTVFLSTILPAPSPI